MCRRIKISREKLLLVRQKKNRIGTSEADTPIATLGGWDLSIRGEYLHVAIGESTRTPPLVTIFPIGCLTAQAETISPMPPMPSVSPVFEFQDIRKFQKTPPSYEVTRTYSDP